MLIGAKYPTVSVERTFFHTSFMLEVAAEMKKRLQLLASGCDETTKIDIFVAAMLVESGFKSYLVDDPKPEDLDKE